jgi:Zinc finger protein
LRNRSRFCGNIFAQDGTSLVFKLARSDHVSPPPRKLEEEFLCRTTELWVLDVDQVPTITLEDDGVGLAVEALQLNELHYPKPFRETSIERDVWEAFKRSCLDKSQEMLRNEEGDESVMDLPGKLSLRSQRLREDIEREEMALREGYGTSRKAYEL